jgi:hypothetical protein
MLSVPRDCDCNDRRTQQHCSGGCEHENVLQLCGNLKYPNAHLYAIIVQYLQSVKLLVPAHLLLAIECSLEYEFRVVPAY